MANGGIIGTVNNPTSSTATGVWQQEEQYEAKVTDTWPQRALFTTKSLRFNDGSSDYLTRTNSGTGSTSKSTISLWTKRSGISSYQDIWESYNDNSNYFRFRFRDDNRLDMQSDISNSTVFLKRTTRVFRDPSAWYHICVVIDLTQSNADKIKLYINGTRETAFDSSTDLTSTSQQFVGGGGNYNFTIGRHPSSDAYYDGYMAEYVFVDGQALDPTSFGVANSDGVWTPIPYSGTFGTNGFNLQFEDSAALGTDSSPNGNTFTVNNLTSIDQSIDYPVVNFATLNPLDTVSNITLSEGNTFFRPQANGLEFGGTTTMYAANGKWYAEFKYLENDDYLIIGITNPFTATYLRQQNHHPGWDSAGGSIGFNARDGKIFKQNSASSYGNAITNNDIISLAFDQDNYKFYVGLNGTWQNSGNPATNSNGVDYSSLPLADDFVGFILGNAGAGYDNINANFGSPAFAISSSNTDGNGYGNFEYAVPSGYYALNTANLAEFG